MKRKGRGRAKLRGKSLPSKATPRPRARKRKSERRKPVNESSRGAQGKRALRSDLVARMEETINALGESRITKGLHKVAQTRYVTPTKARGFRSKGVRTLLNQVSRIRNPRIYVAKLRVSFLGKDGKRVRRVGEFALPRVQDIAETKGKRTLREAYIDYVENSMWSVIHGLVDSELQDFGKTNALTANLKTKAEVRTMMNQIKKGRGIRWKMELYRAVT